MNIKYIGVDDSSLRLFESQYVTPAGMCYNSWVILDDKVAITDTSDARTMEQWKKNLSEALQDRKPDYLIIHHLEPDHASGVEEVMNQYPELTAICSAKTKQMAPQYIENQELIDKRFKVVTEKEKLSLGKHTLSFIMAPMIHWPEVMMTYDETEEVLFSADAFGKFGTMDADKDDWACEARRYYFNICGKYGNPTQTLLKKVSQLKISKILPLHGPVLENEMLTEALNLYSTWSSYAVETEGVFIAHASIHGNTAKAAEQLADILKQKGCPKVAISDLCREDMAEAIEDAFRYGRIIVAASSYDADVFPPMHDFLHHLELKAWQKKKVGIIENGSWAPSAARTMKKMLEGMKDITIVETVVTIRGKVKDSDNEPLQLLADDILK